jgi:hypothetical protein
MSQNITISDFYSDDLVKIFVKQEGSKEYIEVYVNGTLNKRIDGETLYNGSNMMRIKVIAKSLVADADDWDFKNGVIFTKAAGYTGNFGK